MWRSEVSGLCSLRVEGFWSGSATSMVHLLELLILTEHVLLELLVLEVVLEDFEYFMELFLSLGGVQEEDDQARRSVRSKDVREILHRGRGQLLILR